MSSFFQQQNLEVMLTRAQIDAKVAELGAAITKQYAGSDELVVIGILKGSFVFLADLVRAVDLPVVVDFIALSSYGDATESSGVVQLTQDLTRPIAGKHVLVVEDIVDTGLTMKYLLENLSSRHPASLKLASLLEKPARNKSGVKADFLGFSIEDKFVVGYGLDYASKYRNLPFVGVLRGT
ncbi:MAG TPA: hypoxanthine phosphoribosyltransferase [Myxococcota bacterium]